MFSIHVGFGNWAMVWDGRGGKRVRIFGVDIMSYLSVKYVWSNRIMDESTGSKQRGQLGEDMRKEKKMRKQKGCPSVMISCQNAVSEPTSETKEICSNF